MDYRPTCPYCNDKVYKITIPYVRDYGLYEYRFFCKCRNNEEDSRYNEHVAYQTYLEEREKANLTNLEKVFYISDEEIIERRMLKSCKEYENNCEECPWAIISNFLAKQQNAKGHFEGCQFFWEWCRQKAYNE